MRKKQTKQMCKFCVHYRVHYVKEWQRYYEIPSGHCIYPQIKLRFEDNSCQNWTPKGGAALLQQAASAECEQSE